MAQSVIVCRSADLAGESRRDAPSVIVIGAERSSETAVADKVTRNVFVAARRLNESVQAIRLAQRGLSLIHI